DLTAFRRRPAMNVAVRRERPRVRVPAERDVPERARQVKVERAENERRETQREPDDQRCHIEVGPAHGALQTSCLTVWRSARTLCIRRAKPGSAKIAPNSTTARRVSF